MLDDTPTAEPFSPYSHAKRVGEIVAHMHKPDTTVYRPPGVHGPSRRVTQMIGRIARSPLATVAAPGHAPTAQALVENVADAVAYLATSAAPYRRSWRTGGGTNDRASLGAIRGRPPTRIPRGAAVVVLASHLRCGWWSAHSAQMLEDREMLWLGQDQAELANKGWLVTYGAGEDHWRVGSGAG